MGLFIYALVSPIIRLISDIKRRIEFLFLICSTSLRSVSKGSDIGVRKVMGGGGSVGACEAVCFSRLLESLVMHFLVFVHQTSTIQHIPFPRFRLRQAGWFELAKSNSFLKIKRKGIGQSPTPLTLIF